MNLVAANINDRSPQDFELACRKERTCGHGVKTLAAVALFLATGLAVAADNDRESLFGDDLPALGQGSKEGGGTGLRGFVQFELARTTAAPEHWSKMRTRAELASQGALGEGIKWKLSARADYDAVFDAKDFYPAAVERDQRAELVLRENYIDVSSGNWDLRLGRQHVVWGEMVGLFFADVVSARDLREFILPEFDSMRIPQWAARAEYFMDDFHAELLWIPVASYDKIGKPGAEFFPCQPLVPCSSAFYRPERRPARNLDHGNYGLRVSTLKGGWDISGFYYSSMDISPAFARELVGASIQYQARHDRIDQYGGTLAKDFGSVVLKGEAVYTRGRKYGVLRLSDADGLVRQDTVDWAAGFDFTLPAESRFNIQLFQRTYLAHDADIIPDRQENGYSLYLTGKFTDRLQGEALFISSLNRSDWLFRPKLIWAFEKNWRLIFGADRFYGSPEGFFGRYDDRDRVYSEVRLSF